MVVLLPGVLQTGRVYLARPYFKTPYNGNCQPEDKDFGREGKPEEIRRQNTGLDSTQRHPTNHQPFLSFTGSMPTPQEVAGGDAEHDLKKVQALIRELERSEYSELSKLHL